jgi:hypothetical protein
MPCFIDTSAADLFVHSMAWHSMPAAVLALQFLGEEETVFDWSSFLL